MTYFLAGSLCTVLGFILGSELALKVMREGSRKQTPNLNRRKEE